MYRCTFRGRDRNGSPLHFTFSAPLREANGGLLLEASLIDGEWPVFGFWDKAVGGCLSFEEEANKLEIDWTDDDRTTLELGNGSLVRPGIQVRIRSSQFPTVVTATLASVELVGVQAAK